MSKKIPCRILIVEDDDVSAKVARTIFQSRGCTVDIAENGREAVVQVSLSAYDLVLMDWSMPEMNGFDATAEIRRLPGRQSLPIIGTSAVRTREECLAAGMDDLVPKPFSRAKLEPLLERWLPRENCCDACSGAGQA